MGGLLETIRIYIFLINIHKSNFFRVDMGQDSKDMIWIA